MTPFRRIAAYAPPGVAMLVLGLASAVFQSRPGLTPPFEFTVCADEPGPLSTDLGVPYMSNTDWTPSRRPIWCSSSAVP